MAKFFGLFQSVNPDDPLANVKSVKAWVARLPPQDSLGALEAVARLLENLATTQPDFTSDRVLALLTLDRLSLPMQAEIQLQYRLPNLSDDVRRRLWHTCNDLAHWFAYAYEQDYGAVGPDENTQAPGIFSRMFYYRGLQAKLGVFRYETWIPASWQFLHIAYREACARGVVTKPFALEAAAGPGERFSAEQEFIQTLLLQQVNCGNLTPQQLEWAAQWLRAWVHTLKLGEPPVEGDGYWLELGQGDGLAGNRPASPSGDLRYLDIQPLHQQLGALTARLEEQLAQSGGRAVQPEYRVLEEQLKLARQLEDLWRPQARQRARRGERRAETRSVFVVAGWTAILAAMRVETVRRPHAPSQYPFGDVASRAVSGPVRNVEPDWSGSMVRREFDRHGWQLHDTSESGARVLSATKEAQQQQIGALLALQPDGDTEWRIGIVRRLRRRTSEHTELGLEIIAQNATLMQVSPPVAQNSGYSVDGIDAASRNQGFLALYLPSQQFARITLVRSMILPAAEFAPGRNLSIELDGVPRDIRLFAPLEQSKDWVWTAFGIQGEAKPA